MLQDGGISARLISMHTLKPIDKKAVEHALDSTRAIFTIEEHNIIGGLGSAVCEIVCEQDRKVFLRRIGIPDTYSTVIGSHDYLRNAYSLTPEKIYGKIKDDIKSML
jgi:transketolase